MRQPSSNNKKNHSRSHYNTNKHSQQQHELSQQQRVEFVQPISSYNNNNNNILDQAFILYSDQQMISSLSSQSFNSKSYSQIDNDNLSIKSDKSQSQFINNLINNQESSIYDVRSSQCSQSGKQLLHALQPLFNQNVFRRRSPRFTTYDQLKLKEQKHNEKLSSSVKKNLHYQKRENNAIQMLDDNQQKEHQLNNLPTHILQEKYSLVSVKDEKLQQKALITATRSTRSKKMNFLFQSPLYNKGNDTTLDDSQLPKQTNQQDNQYLSKLTKDYLLTARKQKKIKKQQKDHKHHHNNNNRVNHNHHHHNYSLRNNNN